MFLHKVLVWGCYPMFQNLLDALTKVVKISGCYLKRNPTHILKLHEANSNKKRETSALICGKWPILNICVRKVRKPCLDKYRQVNMSGNC